MISTLQPLRSRGGFAYTLWLVRRVRAVLVRGFSLESAATTNDVDGRDFLLWQRNFGRISSNAPMVVGMASEPTASAAAQDAPAELEPALPVDGATLLGLKSAITFSDATVRKTRAAFREAVPITAWRAYGNNAPATTAWPTPIASACDDVMEPLAIDAALTDWFADVTANFADDGRMATELM